VLVDRTIYAFGGNRGCTASERYDIAGDQWALLPNMKLGDFTTAAELNGCIYVLGGTVNSGPVATVEKYNPESRKWTKTPNMSGKKTRMKAAAWRGKVFVTGGVDDDILVLDSCEAYNPSTMRWTQVGSMLTARCDHGLAVVNDRLVALGGEARRGITAKVESYDEESDVWRPLCPMPTPRWNFGCCAVPLAALKPSLREQLGGRALPRREEADHFLREEEQEQNIRWMSDCQRMYENANNLASKKR
jgi:hypothetical protein